VGAGEEHGEVWVEEADPVIVQFKMHNARSRIGRFQTTYPDQMTGIWMLPDASCKVRYFLILNPSVIIMRSSVLAGG
jgi:hypothetical protein